ncbi:flagellar hook-associated protein FlgK [Actinoplanes auranticolor]|uniref:Flagellar hook-associated protein 1 n=1 Tax=Actinoplanes auranticolor TaxID=47988 RepID=A0A919VT17_9ACTN|nr:flagellar hook-associated protein FlgK [Actinoplanes auranticolor]GIM68419.1 flagellar hook-associated protein 1 [Actinoplanes auranticolor]
MGSSFGGINTALTSLYAQRRGLDVTGQNIANANTEGYTRQRVVMQAQVGAVVPSMWAKTDGIGTGVAVSAVQRLRDEYLESRGRAEHGTSAYLASQSASYASIEDAFAEPSDTALAAQLQDMWGGWSDVANNPQLTASRSALIQQSAIVADQLNGAHDALARQWSQSRNSMDVYVDEVNVTAGSIAQLNSSIIQANASGVTVNELEDRRDLLAMRLSELTGATAAKRPNGGMDVFIGGSTLVTGAVTRKVEYTGAARLADQAAAPVALTWKDSGTPAEAGGTVGAMTNTMTRIIPDLAADLDSIAQNLIGQVNALHSQGYSADGDTGAAFFGGNSAGTIKVLITDPDKVAVSGAPGTRDSSVAEAIADIGDRADGPDREYQELIGQLGVVSQGSVRRAEIQGVVAAQIDAAREGQSGVNLDEEMTNLLTFQRGYEAASRVLTTIDSMLDQLINRTGLVGR